jgi:plasmid replication initiation protein
MNNKSHSNELQVVEFKTKGHNYQPNLITESRQEFSDNEKKIVSFIINQFRKDWIGDWKGKNLEFLIPVSELTENKQTRIKECADSLSKKRILQDFGDNPIIEDGVEIFSRNITPFPITEYVKINHSSYIRVTMFSKVVPMFVELGKHYTRYSLEVILSFKSVYSQRFYEIIMMHVGRKQRNIVYSVQKLKFMLNCPESYTYDDLKNRVLKSAQKELQEKAGIVFTFEPSQKEGKKILELTFTVKSNTELALEAMESEAKEYHKGTPLEKRDYVMRLLNNYSFTKTQQNDILSDPKKWSVFMQIDSEIYNGLRQVDNPTAYIAKSLGFDKKSNTTPKGKIK